MTANPGKFPQQRMTGVRPWSQHQLANLQRPLAPLAGLSRPLGSKVMAALPGMVQSVAGRCCIQRDVFFGSTSQGAILSSWDLLGKNSASERLYTEVDFKPGVVRSCNVPTRPLFIVLSCFCRPRGADAESSAVHKRARVESENNGVSEAAPIHPDSEPAKEPFSKDDKQAGNSKTLSSVPDKSIDLEDNKGKHRDRHEEDRRRDDRRSHASKERYATSTRPTAFVLWLMVHLSDQYMPSACPEQAEDV